MKTSQKVLKQKVNTSLFKNHQGFSLLEILVTLGLIAIIGGVVISGVGIVSSRIDEAVSDVERAIRFSVHETILKGSVVRLKINLDDEANKYLIEYGPKAGLALPDFSRYDDQVSLSLQETEKLAKIKKQLDMNFKPVQEFAEERSELPPNISFVAVGTTLRNGELVETGDGTVYFYPSGERDGAIIFLANDEELVTIEIFPFTEEIQTNFLPLESNDDDEIADEIQNKVKDIHEAWLSK